jgi:hypothetical protein
MLAKVILIDEDGFYEEYRFANTAFRIASFYKDRGLYKYIAIEKIPFCISNLWYCLIRKTFIHVFQKNS